MKNEKTINILKPQHGLSNYVKTANLLKPRLANAMICRYSSCLKHNSALAHQGEAQSSPLTGAAFLSNCAPEPLACAHWIHCGLWRSAFRTKARYLKPGHGAAADPGASTKHPPFWSTGKSQTNCALQRDTPWVDVPWLKEPEASAPAAPLPHKQMVSANPICWMSFDSLPVPAPTFAPLGTICSEDCCSTFAPRAYHALPSASCIRGSALLSYQLHILIRLRQPLLLIHQPYLAWIYWRT